MGDTKDEFQKKEARARARKKMMDLLARRDHSEREIRRKMREKHAPEDIEAALEYGKEKGWVPNDDKSKAALSQKMAEFLHKRLKGIHYINQHLMEKGLPQIRPDSERELEKAQLLLENKFSNKDWQDPQIKAKVGRFLASRGFEMSIVRDVVFKRPRR